MFMVNNDINELLGDIQLRQYYLVEVETNPTAHLIIVI